MDMHRLRNYTGGFSEGDAGRKTLFDEFVIAALAAGKTPAVAIETASQAIDERRRYFAKCEDKLALEERRVNELREAARKVEEPAGMRPLVEMAS
jgi:hypothetical protein